MVFCRYAARYDLLEAEFEIWSVHCCEHERSTYVEEWVCNWTGVTEVVELVEAVGGESEFPLLPHLLPHANGDCCSAELAKAMLAELKRFSKKVRSVTVWSLCDAQTGEEVQSCTDGGFYTWMRSSGQRIGMCGNKVFFAGP